MKKIILFCFISLLLISSCKNNDAENKVITQLSLSQTQAQLAMGDSLSLTLSYTPADLPAPTCNWTSSDTTVARVDNKGKIKAEGRGTTTITVATTTTDASRLVITTQCKLTVTYKGDGSVSNPYLIYTVADLKAIRDSINTKNGVYGNKAYKLMANLDFSKETSDWTPIGDTTTVAFKGIFDGNGKTIKGVHIAKTDNKSYGGIFGNIEGAEIKNLGINWNSLFGVNLLGDYYVGGIAAYGSGTIINCYTSGEIHGSAHGFAYAGGILGNGTATITNCYSNGRITAFSFFDSNGAFEYVGGILGKGTTTITNCHYDSKTLGSYGATCRPRYAGGIAGHITGTISSCYSIGKIGCPSKFGGGIAGYSIGTIINCYTTEEVESLYSNEETNGGIAGQSEGTIINCYSTGATCGIYVGGIAGSGTDITNCYTQGVVLSRHAGGIAAAATNVSYCIALNSVIAASSTASKSTVARICSLFSASGIAKNNYASSSIVVQKDILAHVTVTDFSDTKLHGLDLTAQPVDLLNAYVSSNPTFSNIGLKKWKVTAGVNNGYPVFE
jgi:hypothetical protein